MSEKEQSPMEDLKSNMAAGTVLGGALAAGAGSNEAGSASGSLGGSTESHRHWILSEAATILEDIFVKTQRSPKPESDNHYEYQDLAQVQHRRSAGAAACREAAAEIRVAGEAKRQG